MTIEEVINRIDYLKPNGYSKTDKIKWINNLEWIIKKELVDTHNATSSFNGYNSDTNTNTKLIISDTCYDDIYIYYIEAQIDYVNGEYQKYNNSIIRFNEMYSALSNSYNREHLPKPRNFKIF